MVLTTVGYGEKSPDSAVGQLIGGLCALLGVFILALPVPIIVNSFSENYKNRVWKGQVMLKKQERSEQEKKEPRPSKEEWTAKHAEMVKKSSPKSKTNSINRRCNGMLNSADI